MKIYSHRTAPYELLRWIEKCNTEYPEAEMKAVIIDNDCVTKGLVKGHTKPTIAAVMPVEKCIIIDLDVCLADIRWVKCGIRYVANVFLNMMFGFNHELGHLLQLANDTSIVEYDHLPPEYENAASKFAEEMLLDWSIIGVVPKIEDMGWAGEKIMEFFNSAYATDTHQIIEEIQLDGTMAAAKAELAAMLSKEYSEKEEVVRLLTDIRRTNQLSTSVGASGEENKIGVVINNTPYLTHHEVLGINHLVEGKE